MTFSIPHLDPVDHINGIPVVGIAPLKNARYWTEWNLANWASWMRLGGRPSGYLNKASGGLMGYTIYTGDTDSYYAEADGLAAVTTNAAICDLTPVEQCAVHHRYMQAVYRFNRELYYAVLERAIHRVTAGLLKRGAWLGD